MYRCRVSVIPAHRRCVRQGLPPRIFATQLAKRQNHRRRTVGAYRDALGLGVGGLSELLLEQGIEHIGAVEAISADGAGCAPGTGGELICDQNHSLRCRRRVHPPGSEWFWRWLRTRFRLLTLAGSAGQHTSTWEGCGRFSDSDDSAGPILMMAGFCHRVAHGLSSARRRGAHCRHPGHPATFVRRSTATADRNGSGKGTSCSGANCRVIKIVIAFAVAAGRAV